ncbi:hypothetical protein [Rosistilla oblonga]|uniref:S-adenosyl-L-methionine-dependent methyltransferase n=1 Tax=Rosistilla oblonga TaxID=2527990 RepID=A0A518IVN9_9BACT|nr:hypothetical protein [Rosistilla oblonga]QDV57145.1 hypothetical protein Mal33_31460 [Rosistilla oblonga]
MNRILHSQSQHNLQSRDGWDCARDHRRRVMAMLLENASPTKRLCVLGAGNCNDIDLPELADAYREVVLVDLDGDAMLRGVEKQFSGASSPQRSAKIKTVVGDLTGISELLSQAVDAPQNIDSIVAAIEARLQQPPDGLRTERFDTVASVCLLSQLVHSVTETIGAHAQLLSIVQAVRRQHLHLLRHLMQPGGRGILITDFVSSLTAPQLPHVPNDQLPQYVRQLLNQQNFFTGLNPAVLAHQMQTDSQFADGLQRLQSTAPWIWDFGPRQYAVCGFQFDTRRDGPPDAIPQPPQRNNDV